MEFEWEKYGIGKGVYDLHQRFFCGGNCLELVSHPKIGVAFSEPRKGIPCRLSFSSVELSVTMVISRV